jgi:hypothetical protein
MEGDLGTEAAPRRQRLFTPKLLSDIHAYPHLGAPLGGYLKDDTPRFPVFTVSSVRFFVRRSCVQAHVCTPPSTLTSADSSLRRTYFPSASRFQARRFSRLVLVTLLMRDPALPWARSVRPEHRGV